MIAKLTGDPSGAIRGEDALRAYSVRGLERFPDLTFTTLPSEESPS